VSESRAPQARAQVAAAESVTVPSAEWGPLRSAPDFDELGGEGEKSAFSERQERMLTEDWCVLAQQCVLAQSVLIAPPRHGVAEERNKPDEPDDEIFDRNQQIVHPATASPDPSPYAIIPDGLDEAHQKRKGHSGR
jgi:hypothetical protein